MPLHLLGKKSWNPYNPNAITRVRADEAAAAAREEAEEQRQQEEDAQYRLAILRGEEPLPPAFAIAESSGQNRGEKRRRDDGDREEKTQKRRLRGEDDTDRDIRVARKRVDQRHDSKPVRRGSDHRRERDAPIVDHAGHIQLFAPKQITQGEKNQEAETERKRKEQEMEDQYTMRFSNAAGYKKGMKDAPWYAAKEYSGTEALDEPDKFAETLGTNAFGQEDPGRHKRDASRLAQADPMAAMRQAQSKLKTNDRKREERRLERERESFRQTSRSDHSYKDKVRSKHRMQREEEELENFSLDGPDMGDQRHEKPDRSRHGGRDRRHKYRYHEDYPREHERIGNERSHHHHQHRRSHQRMQT